MTAKYHDCMVLGLGRVSGLSSNHLSDASGESTFDLKDPNERTLFDLDPLNSPARSSSLKIESKMSRNFPPGSISRSVIAISF